ncbi:hypothetical protein GGH96_006266 [Coemansia sp. RSA 1972]|nr:hypothetical protein GGH96_006266 [Coemansia sp. RSA 1972]
MVRLAYGLSGLLALAATVSGADSSGERVIGGAQATEGMFPFMVHLYKDGSPYCGGTLIDAEWVVTAAHCVAEADGNSSGAGSFVPTNPALFKVGYGTNSGSLGDYVEVDSIVVSTGFDPVWYTSDIALIKIKSNNDLITKAKSTTVSTASIVEGQTVITAGWGQTTNDNTDQSSALMYAGLVVADDDTCKAAAVDWNGQNGRYVCTSFSTAPGIGTCFGDSGGPLLLSTGGGYMLLGIVSFDVNTKDASNARCAQDGNISYFTRVSSYLSFITSVTGINEGVLTGASSPWSHNAASISSTSSTSDTSSSSSSSSSSSNKKDGDDTNDKKNDDDKNDDTDDDKDNGKDSTSSSSSGSSQSSDSGKTTDKSSATSDETTDKSSTISDKPTGSPSTDESDSLQENVDDKSSKNSKSDSDDDKDSNSSAAQGISTPTSTALAMLAFFVSTVILSS